MEGFDDDLLRQRLDLNLKLRHPLLGFGFRLGPSLTCSLHRDYVGSRNAGDGDRAVDGLHHQTRLDRDRFFEREWRRGDLSIGSIGAQAVVTPPPAQG
ncbi:MAG: hypothetical protein OEM15_14325 [Myxococcales bacterium]|nr:hypothetical protein [Myxococcales bacterium]